MSRFVIIALGAFALMQISLAVESGDKNKSDNDGSGSDEGFIGLSPIKMGPANYHGARPLEMVECKSADNLVNNADYLSSVITSVEYAPNPIKEDEINELSNSIASKPTELQAPLEDLVAALNKFYEITDEEAQKVSSELQAVTNTIHSDIDVRDVVKSKVDDLSDASKLSKSCAYIVDAEKYALQFVENVRTKCLLKFQKVVIPKLDGILKERLEITQKNNNVHLSDAEIVVAKNEIQDLIAVVQAESKGVEKNAAKSKKPLIKCIEDYGTACEKYLNENLQKIQKLLA